MRRKIAKPDGLEAISAYLSGSASDALVATAVRFLLEELGTTYPGNARKANRFGQSVRSGWIVPYI